jgi:hypothetical protein
MHHSSPVIYSEKRMCNNIAERNHCRVETSAWIEVELNMCSNLPLTSPCEKTRVYGAPIYSRTSSLIMHMEKRSSDMCCRCKQESSRADGVLYFVNNSAVR